MHDFMTHIDGCAKFGEGAFDKTFEVNVKGYFLMAQHAARMMIDQGSGSIINIASIAGFSPPPMQGIYGVTKAAVIAMTKMFAKELSGAGVRTNAIAPGLVETKFAQVLIDSPEMLEQLRALENGAKIRVVDAASRSIGVDTEEDLKIVRGILEAEEAAHDIVA